MAEPQLDLYKLVVRAVDHGFPSKSSDADVLVEVPANFEPQIDTYYKFEAEENLEIGSVVGQIQATDRNVNDQLNYFILENCEICFKELSLCSGSTCQQRNLEYYL